MAVLITIALLLLAFVLNEIGYPFFAFISLIVAVLALFVRDGPAPSAHPRPVVAAKSPSAPPSAQAPKPRGLDFAYVFRQAGRAANTLGRGVFYLFRMFFGRR